jgi:hypothetical protein
MIRPLISLLFTLALAGVARAEIIGVAGGTAAPPPTLGPYEMTPFPPDERPILIPVTTVPSPLGGELTFSVPLTHRRIGEGWGGWSHGYMGDVYDTAPHTEVTLGLPEETRAFYFYAATYPTSPQYITATTDDGTSIGEEIQTFHAAEYFGFYSDDFDDVIESITIAATATFAIGEFGIAIPEPGMLGLLALGGLLVLRRRCT